MPARQKGIQTDIHISRDR